MAPPTYIPIEMKRFSDLPILFPEPPTFAADTPEVYQPLPLPLDNIEKYMYK